LRSPHKIRYWLPHFPVFSKRLITKGLIVALFTIVTFSALQPYAVIDFDEFLKQNIIQSQMTYNAYVFPYTLQYVGKIPYFYELKNIFLWGLGPFIFSVAMMGLVRILYGFRKLNARKKAELSIIFIFFVCYFLLVGGFAVGWMRYLLPIYPLIAVLGGVGLIFVIEKINTFNNAIRYIGFVTLIGLILLWPLSFSSIYSKPNTRIEASRWIDENLPSGTTLAVEHWDDRLPMSSKNVYNFQELNLYDQPDNQTKWDSILQKLNASDYLIIASNRLYVPIQNLSDCSKYKVCYPIGSKYYKDIFSQKSGFIKIAEFSSYPTIPFTGFRIDDQGADESFTVYDHPKIMIFKKR
jgi:hypothetical protein